MKFLLGFGIGIITALLFAPARGEETRRRIVETAQDLGNTSQQKVQQVQEKIQQTARQAQEKVSQAASQVTETAREKAANIGSTVGRQAGESVANSVLGEPKTRTA